MKVIMIALFFSISAYAQTVETEECRVAVSYTSNATRDVADIDVEAAFEEAMVEQAFMMIPASHSPNVTVNVNMSERWTSGLFPNCLCNFGQTRKRGTTIRVVDENGITIYSAEKSGSLGRRDINREVRSITNRLMRSRLSCSFRRIP